MAIVSEEATTVPPVNKVFMARFPLRPRVAGRFFHLPPFPGSIRETEGTRDAYFTRGLPQSSRLCRVSAGLALRASRIMAAMMYGL